MMGTINSPNTSVRVRGGHTKHTPTSTKRISSGDERKYIEHLEGELSAVQSGLPSVAQEHTVRMNHINAENRQLQAQLKDWETRYNEEVRDYVQQHSVVERQLRSKNSNLEDYASRAKDRVMELEAQLERIQHALEGAEAANIQLERRVEIMSELLTSTPAAERPTRPRMRARPLSMLPRHPDNRGSWIGSPERAPDLGAPSSPAIAHAQLRDVNPDLFEPLERIVSREVWPSPHPSSEHDEQENPQSARSSTVSDYWTLQEQARARPGRRMRRFNNSNGPKPLILPYTTQADPHATLISPVERQETTLDFSFRRSVHLDTRASPILPRPRAVTSASEHALRLSDSPVDGNDEAGFERILSLAQQRSSSRAYSFISTAEHAGVASRNLLDELHAAKSDELQAMPGGINDDFSQSMSASVNDDFEQLSRMTTLDNDDDNLFMIPAPILPSPLSHNAHSLTPQWDTASVELSPMTTRSPFNPALESIMGPLRSNSPDAEATPKASVTQKSEQATGLNLSALDRLRSTFGDLLYSPADLARMIVHATQQHMHIPPPLLSVQWWVVGLVWGPMAKRRMGDNSRHRSESVGASPSLALDESMAYGTVYTSPVSGLRRRAGMAGPGKKRSGHAQHCTEEKTLLARHNPLLWVKFTITLAYAVGIAFTSGPGALLPSKQCTCPSCKHAD